MEPTQFFPDSQPPVPRAPIRQLKPSGQTQPPVYPMYRGVFRLALALLALETVVAGISLVLLR